MSSIKDSDSIYSRDLLVAPVRALSAVVRQIQDGIFHPDNPRSNSYPQGEPGVPGRPNPVFQPTTPVFSGAKTVAEPRTDAGVFQDPDEFVDTLLQEESHGHVKEEQTIPTHETDCVDLVSESVSESETSSFNSDFADSDVDEPESGGYVGLQASLKTTIEYPKEHAFVKNNRSKITHCIPIGDQVSGSVYSNGNLLQQTLTACGRSTSSNYEMGFEISDWTVKCRICFKGRRGPALE